MGEGIAKVVLNYCNLRTLLSLWALVCLLMSAYVFLYAYLPFLIGQKYFNVLSQKVVTLSRADIPFFIERQRRTVYELSRSEYIQNLIKFTQGEGDVSEERLLRMESFIKAYQQYFGYKQVLLFDMTGHCVFSTVKELQNENINDEKFKAHYAVASYHLTAMTLTADITPFVYDPSIGDKVIFITMPVFFKEALIGCMLVQINNNEVEKMLVRTVALGKTGEYVVSQRITDHVMFILSPVGKPNLTLPIDATISREAGDPAVRAALGYQGHGITTDYRGVKTVAAWYFLPQFNWGFACKTDYAEVMKPVRILGYVALLLFVTALLCSLLYFLKRKAHTDSFRTEEDANGTMRN
jgi:hypothetical protein